MTLPRLKTVLSAPRQAPVCFVPVTSGREQRSVSRGHSGSSSGSGSGKPSPSTGDTESGDEGTSSTGGGGGGGFSYFNDAEAAAVMSLVRGLLTAGSLPAGAADIGVITPYNGQVNGCALQCTV